MLDLVGQRNFLIDRSVSYTRPLVCFQGLFLKSGSALCVNLGLLCITGSASLFGDSPSRIEADTESRPLVWLVPAFCFKSYIWLVLHTCTYLVVANPQTCEKLFKEKTGAHPHFLVIKVKIKFSNHFSSLCSRLQSDFLV